VKDTDLKILSQEEIDTKLKKYPGWIFRDDKIIKEFLFPSFSSGIDFLVKLTPYCESIDHHPDVHIYYKKIIFELTRFSVGGKVTERDFKVASKIESLWKKE
jgi:4a-hydroxytetrahydrobiopterin dehydratase